MSKYSAGTEAAVLTTETLVTLVRDECWEYSQMISNETLALSVQYMPMAASYMMQALLRPMTEKLDSTEITYPSSWWQHFKQDCFPQWLLLKFPVAYTTHRVDIKAAYPLVSLPNEKHHVFFTRRVELQTGTDDE